MEQRPARRRERSPPSRVAHSAPARGAAVEVVAHDRVPVRREVHADLVRAARLRRERQVGHRRQARERLVSRDGGFPVPLTFILRPSFGSRPRGSSKTPLPGTGMTPRQRPVGLPRLSGLEGARQRPMRRVGSRQEDHAGRADVEAVDEKQLRIRRLAAGREEAGDGGGSGGRIARGRHRNARRLVEGDGGLVFEEPQRVNAGSGRTPSATAPRRSGAPALSTLALLSRMRRAQIART